MFVKLYLITLPVFLGIDFVWLSIMSKLVYQKKLGFLLAKNPNYLAAFIFYLLFAAGIVVGAISLLLVSSFAAFSFLTIKNLSPA